VHKKYCGNFAGDNVWNFKFSGEYAQKQEGLEVGPQKNPKTISKTIFNWCARKISHLVHCLGEGFGLPHTKGGTLTCFNVYIQKGGWVTGQASQGVGGDGNVVTRDG